MITYYNTYGKVSLTNDYFAELVSAAASSCYGVADLAASGAGDAFKGVLYKDRNPDKGVRVTALNGKLAVELHIKVTYGVNIAAIVKSITHKVKYTVEEATGLKVSRVRVSVDDMVS